jgi:hypothetical protein
MDGSFRYVAHHKYRPPSRTPIYKICPERSAIVDDANMLFDVIVTPQVERLAHALNVSLRKERTNVRLKARRFRHRASHALEYMDARFPSWIQNKNLDPRSPLG